VSMVVWIGMSVIEIQTVTHNIQMWPKTLLNKSEQNIKILLKVINEHKLKTEERKCLLTVKLVFELIQELQLPSDPVTQLQVPHNLSQVGIKAMVKYFHKIHYIAEPTLKTMTRFQASQFCRKQLDVKDFTYFSHRELLTVSKYFNIMHGLIFNGLKVDKKVVYLLRKTFNAFSM